MRAQLGDGPPSTHMPFDALKLDWFDLRNMVMVAECVVMAALARRESRGAHQRQDHPGTDAQAKDQTLRLQSGKLVLGKSPAHADMEQTQ